MNRRCSVCRHSDLPVIEAALAAGRSNRSVAASYGLSEQAIRRHRAHPVLPPASADLARQLATLNALAIQAR